MPMKNVRSLYSHPRTPSHFVVIPHFSLSLFPPLAHGEPFNTWGIGESQTVSRVGGCHGCKWRYRRKILSTQRIYTARPWEHGCNICRLNWWDTGPHAAPASLFWILKQRNDIFPPHQTVTKRQCRCIILRTDNVFILGFFFVVSRQYHITAHLKVVHGNLLVQFTKN